MNRTTTGNSICSFLYKQADNAPLVVFRILFGLIVFTEAASALYSGWVKEVFINTPFTITFIGFEWLGFLHGTVMYYYYGVMALAGLFISAGLFYRFSTTLLALLWSGIYFAQKTQYNNHYYLMLLLCFIMAVAPAHRRFSLDAKRGAVSSTNHCDHWCIFLFQFQITCVFFFAAIAKLYPDWLHAIPLKIWLANKNGMGGILQTSWMPYTISYLGIVFDLLLVPALCFKRTRIPAFIAAVIFNWFNGTVFSIGTFPYTALSLTLFFFPASFFKSIVPNANVNPYKPLSLSIQKRTTFILGMYMLIQFALPLRHWLIPGNVLWSEEGHRLSWRMMLRHKKGEVTYKITDKQTGQTWYETPSQRLSAKQSSTLANYPDMIWQYAQILKGIYNKQGHDVRVFANSKVSLNGRPSQQLTDTTADLANLHRQAFAHNTWILPHPGL